MNADLSKLVAGGSEFAAKCELRVVLVCEDFSAGMHALQTFDRLFAGRGGSEANGAQSVWKFDLLGVSTLRDIAAAEAAAADLVIMALHGPGKLPECVKQWLEMMIGRRDHRPGAFVTLLDDAGGNAFQEFPVELDLKKSARRAGMEFFAHKAAGRLAFEDHELAMDPAEMARTFAALSKDLFGGDPKPAGGQSFGSAQPSFEA